jgi:hypothetical protein
MIRRILPMLIVIAAGVIPTLADDQFYPVCTLESEDLLKKPDSTQPYDFFDGSVGFEVGSHGDGPRRYPVFKFDAPVLSADRYALSGTAWFDAKRGGSAVVEFWSDLSDGSRFVTTVPVVNTTQPADLLVPAEITYRVWPVRMGVDVLVTGTGTMRLGRLDVRQATPRPTPTTAATAEEKVVRRFTRGDLDKSVRDLVSASWNGNRWGFPSYDQLTFNPLPDGTSRSAFMIGLGVYSPGGHPVYNRSDPNNATATVHRIRLLTIDRPHLSGGASALIGRIGEVFDDSQGQPHPDAANVRLEMTAEFDGGPPVTTSFRPTSLDAQRVNPQLFRLQIDGSKPPSRITLNLVLPAWCGVTFDEIDLVEPGKPTPPPAPAPECMIPDSFEPVAIDSPLNLDAAVAEADSTSEGGGPIVQSGNSEQIYATFGRPTLDGSPRRLELVAQDIPMLHPGTIGITGSVSYRGLDRGTDMTGPAWLELTTDYADGSHTVTASRGRSGPTEAMVGRTGDRPFAVVATSTAQPVRLKLALVCTGTGVIHLSPMSLVQYEPPPPTTEPTIASAALPAPPIPPPWWTLARFTRPTGFAVVGLMGLAAAVFLVPGVASQTWGLLFVLALIAESAFAWGMFLLGRGIAPAGVAPLLAAPVAWLLPAIARGLVSRRVRRKELRRMYTLDATS